ncbi:aminotransferase class I/II-fold pyridoxal phosphate-dependent enzyme [Streptomyces fuscichromogenes]|uniref:aminotransferase class I/II-fold pyridoxal phosphate-dependent enzyme n=1 Tax=Streptomyces fuscichromogenes TaxID=1324013 RepID=UPI003827E8BA
MAGMAIVGMSCRFPGAANIDEYWKILLNAEPQFSGVPKNRWDHSAYHRPGDFREPHGVYTDRVAFLSEVDRFAPSHYGIPPRRARTMDPQAKLFVDLAREALQDAGWERDGYDRARTGVFAGVTSLDHRDVSVSRISANLLADGSFHEGQDDPELLGRLHRATDTGLMPFNSFTIPGCLANMVPCTVSEVLDLGGPSVSLDAACSSALVALDAAIRSLRSGACSIALVGGVYIGLSPTPLVGFARSGALSRRGVCRPFDERADGFVLGEGGATLVLRPVEDAVAAGDRIYAVVTGVGSANDGRGGGPMTPQAQGQLAALRAAYRDAGTAPGLIDLLEAHGTGTPVGDRTEIEAVGLLRTESGSPRTCYVSSSKALIGHTLSAAGAAGLVKAALAVHHGVIPPQPADIKVNGALDLAASGLRLTTTPQEWPHDELRRAGVSSFGFGGTNVHAVLEGAPTAGPARTGGGNLPDDPWLVLLSAGSIPDLARHAEDIRRSVAADPDTTPGDVAHTLARRQLLTARLAFAAATREELLDRLREAARRLAAGALGELAPGVHAAARPLPADERRIAFAFPGQGSQRPGMLADLVRRFPSLAARAADLVEVTGEESGTVPQSLPGLLWEGHAADDTEAREALMVTDMCQPGLGVTGASTVELLAACGIEPDVTVGHSVGEFPAAVAAGVVSADQAVRFMAKRGAALASAVAAGTGAMLAVQAPVAEAERLGHAVEGVWPACYNHDGQVVFSGRAEAVEVLRAHCVEAGFAAVRLRVSHAFHSPLVAAADEAMAETIAALPLTGPSRTFVSGVSGRECRRPQEIKELWAHHNTAPVQFTDAVRTVAASGVRFLVQIYGGDTLLRMARNNEAGAAVETLPLTVGRPDAGRALLTALGRLAVAGAPLDPAVIFPQDGGRLLSLPPSPLKTSVYSVRTGGSRRERAVVIPSPTGGSPAERTGPVALSCNASSFGAASLSGTTTASGATAATEQSAARATAPGLRAVIPAPLPTSPIGEPRMSGLIEFLHAQVSLIQSFDPAGRGLSDPVLPTITLPTGEPTARTAAEQAPQPQPTASVPVPAEEVKAVVCAGIAKVSAYPEDFLRPEQVFATDLGFDSIMLAELATRLRGQWPDLQVTVAEMTEISTIGDLVTTVRTRLGGRPAARPLTVEAPALQSPPPTAEPVPATAPAARRETADVRLFPEVLASLERKRGLEASAAVNPYFLRHEGTIRGTTRIGGQELISFSSYNYLGLSGHPTVAAAVQEAVERYGSSVSAARILSGNRPLHDDLDRGLAELVGAQDAVSLVSGHATNVTVIGHLMGPQDLILHDALAHDSIIQGCRQSGSARQPFPHNDVVALDRILDHVRGNYRRVLIVVEGVYSMDGDTADLSALIGIKKRHDALLMVDEAHSIGVMGKTGGGMAEFSGANPDDVDVWMGTLSKSLASCGGYVAGRRELIEHFRYTLPGFVFSAGLPPASAAAALTALRLIREEPERVTRLHDNAALFLRLAAEAGVDVGTSEGTPVIPAITGDSLKALRLADRLYARGVSANPILHPAVEERLARLRFFITSEHTEEQITTAVRILGEEIAGLG